MPSNSIRNVESLELKEERARSIRTKTLMMVLKVVLAKICHENSARETSRRPDKRSGRSGQAGNVSE